MASTTFIDFSPPVVNAAWLNDINGFFYTLFGAATTASAARSAIGLGTMATQNASSVAITGGSVVGITDLLVADGGTGASTASGARTNLGLVIGTDVAPVASPTFTGDPKAPTPAVGDNDTSIATSAFVNSQINFQQLPTVRQTVLVGPVDTSGLAAFGGSTGSTTVTTTAVSASNPLTITAAGGYLGDRTGTTTSNISFTGLSTNGTMYLYVDISATGTFTTGSTTVLPIYQFGGTPATTSNQATFNIQQMQMFVGNGTTAPQTYRVFIGEVTVAGAVVTAITWYTVMGRYQGPWTNTLPGTTTATSANHNIGVAPTKKRFKIECIMTDNGYAVGDQLDSNNGITSDNAGTARTLAVWASRLSEGSITGSSSAFGFPNKSTGTQTALTAANWKYRYEAERGW